MSQIRRALLISFGLLASIHVQGAEAPAASSTMAIADSAATAVSAATATASATAIAIDPASSPGADAAEHTQMQRISALLMTKFGLAKAKAEQITSAVMNSASKYSLSPALVLAIISIESRFREKARGSHGATGLMQVVPAAHRRLVGKTDLTQPAANIEAGSAILHGYLQSAQGDLTTALRYYGGSTAYARNVSLHARDFEASLGASAPGDAR